MLLNTFLEIFSLPTIISAGGSALKDIDVEGFAQAPRVGLEPTITPRRD